MAAQVLTGTDTSLSYTNNTGQNVRIVINYLKTSAASTLTAGNTTISPIGNSINGNITIGRNLATIQIPSNSTTPVPTNNLIITGPTASSAVPTELMLSTNQTFSVTGSSTYNIVVIPEAG